MPNCRTHSSVWALAIEAQLKNNDKIRIGTTVFKYVEVDPARQKTLRLRIILAAVAVVLLFGVYKVLQPENKIPKYLARGNQLIAEQKGQQFDPAIVDAFEACYEQFLEVLESLRDSGLATASAPASGE